MKVQLLSRYSRLGASSRLRTLQYQPFLLKAGIDVKVDPLFDDEYLLTLYRGHRKTMNVVRCYGRRVAQSCRSRSGEATWLEKEALPNIPWALERILLPSRLPLITDYDDAVFHRYDLSPIQLKKWLLGTKIDRVMAASTLVMAGNAYLAGRATQAGARRVVIVPTVVDTDVYETGPLPPADGKLRIGWIGSPSTWVGYVSPLIPLLMQVARTTGSIVRAVGTGKTEEADGLEALPWSEETEVAMIRSMALGIMPLDDSPFARGKCGYKLIQYMACGLPVVASPVGVNSDIVEHGVNGFLASTDAEWREALLTLLGDAELRQRMGAAGRAKVEREYSLQVWGPKVAQLMVDVIQEHRVRTH